MVINNSSIDYMKCNNKTELWLIMNNLFFIKIWVIKIIKKT